jgi:RNA polymerase sigma-70 factor (ECF subfamily)
MTDRPDDELVLAAARGDPGAFAFLVERHHGALMQFVCRFLGLADRNQAEDLAQDVFLAAWKAAPTFRPRPGVLVLSWLLRIATNICLNYRRGACLRVAASLDRDPCAVPESADCAEPEITALAQERAECVRAALAELPPMQRAALILREYHDLSYAEIAEVIDTSVSAVEALLFRGRSRLRDLLTAEEFEPPPQVFPDWRAESL